MYDHTLRFDANYHSYMFAATMADRYLHSRLDLGSVVGVVHTAQDTNPRGPSRLRCYLQPENNFRPLLNVSKSLAMQRLCRDGPFRGPIFLASAAHPRDLVADKAACCVTPAEPSPSVARPSPGGAIMRCMKVEEIAEAIVKLPPDQFARFRRWFAAFEAGRTDHAEVLDSTATKLGRLAGRAFAELKKRAKEP